MRPCSSQDAGGAVAVLGRSGVARGGEGQEVGGKVEPGADHGHGLQRLERGARVERGQRVAGGEQDAAVRRGGDERAVVDAFHEAVAGLDGQGGRAAAGAAERSRAGAAGAVRRGLHGHGRGRHGVLGWCVVGGAGCWGYWLEDGVEGHAHGAEVLAHGGAGFGGGAGFDGVEDALVFDVGGVLAVGHHVQGFGLVGQGVADVGHDAFEHLVAAGPGDGGVEAGIEGHPGFGVGFRGHRRPPCRGGFPGPRRCGVRRRGRRRGLRCAAGPR